MPQPVHDAEGPIAIEFFSANAALVRNWPGTHSFAVPVCPKALKPKEPLAPSVAHATVG